MSRSKAKGTAAETALCDYLRPLFPYVERRALRGTGDLCDIAGIPGAVIEVKNCREWRLSEWLRATVAKARPSRSLPFVVVKAPGKGTARVGEWFAVTDVATMARLLGDADVAPWLPPDPTWSMTPEGDEAPSGTGRFGRTASEPGVAS